MIKLTIELKDEEFQWGYEVAKCTTNGIEPVTPESLRCFTLMLEMCHRGHTQRYKEWENEINAKAYLEKHPELLTTPPSK